MKHVIIVEDNDECAFLLQHQLNKLKFLSSVCTNPFTIIERVKNKMVDALTVDIGLPEVNGIEIIRQVRKINKEILIVVVTAQAMEETRIDCLKAGADYFIRKPYSLEELKIAFHAIKE